MIDNAGVSQTTTSFLWFDGPSFDGTLKTVTTTTAKETLTCKQSLTVSVYPSRYAVWPLEIILRPDIRKDYISIDQL